MNSETTSSKCVDSDFSGGTLLDFENPSDAIFASLFLTADGISWKYFDAILSTIRNPLFDTKKIKFKDSSDFFARVAQCRARALITRRRDATQVTRVPEIVLDGLFDVLGEELHGAFSLIRRENNGFLPTDFHAFSLTYKAWRTTLINSALVHSSWLAPARRALGSSHRLTQYTLPHSVKNPWIGGWTQELHILVSTDRSSFSTNIPLLRKLFARLPRIKSLHLTMGRDSHSRPNKDKLNTTFCKSLYLLQSLEEISFTLSITPIPESLIEALCETALMNLKVLRFLKVPMTGFTSLEIPDKILPLTHVFPSLHSLQLDSTETSNTGFLQGILWSKDVAHPSASPSSFIPSDIRVSMTTSVPGNNLWAPLKSSLRIVRRMNCKCWWPDHNHGTWGELSKLNDLQTIFTLCSSLRSLSIHGTIEKSDVVSVMKSIPRSVEELDFTFPLRFSYERIEEWDAELAKALLPVTSPSLRVFRMHFFADSVQHNSRIYMDADRQLCSVRPNFYEEGYRARGESDLCMKKSPLFPLCQKVCEEREVNISVDALLVEAMWY